jgi:hypothetical protein
LIYLFAAVWGLKKTYFLLCRLRYYLEADLFEFYYVDTVSFLCRPNSTCGEAEISLVKAAISFMQVVASKREDCAAVCGIL